MTDRPAARRGSGALATSSISPECRFGLLPASVVALVGLGVLAAERVRDPGRRLPTPTAEQSADARQPRKVRAGGRTRHEAGRETEQEEEYDRHSPDLDPGHEPIMSDPL